jgi:hypothetical protein
MLKIADRYFCERRRLTPKESFGLEAMALSLQWIHPG